MNERGDTEPMRGRNVYKILEKGLMLLYISVCDQFVETRVGNFLLKGTVTYSSKMTFHNGVNRMTLGLLP
jgi:hypothetical protein